MAQDLLVTGLGGSAGAIPALRSVLSGIQPGRNIAYVVVLHLSPTHESQLAEVLQLSAPIPVRQVTATVEVMPDQVYVIPPNRNLSMVDGALTVSEMTRLEERRSPIDTFFRALGDTHGPHACCVILSGSGADGSMGLKRVKEHGGLCLVQDPAEAEYADMPRNAIATGLIDEVLPAGSMAARIVSYSESIRGLLLEKPVDHTETDARALRDVLTLLRTRTGHDFSNYKQSTLLRRLGRRLAVNEFAELPAYARHLREHPEESQALLRDLLISVTNFFRDPTAFAALEQRVIPRLFEGKGEDDSVRVWVAGCATGEEACSIAMLLAEHASERTGMPAIQVFATDIDQHAIAIARDGVYNAAEAADIDPERLRRFFASDGDHYRVRKELRDMMLFAHHNVIKDPPFLHLDLVTCRNLLIYLTRPAQERVLEVMHFALSAEGFLFLGPSESVEGSSDFFAAIEKDAHIYQARGVASRPPAVIGEVPIIPRVRLRETEDLLSRRSRDRLSFPDLHHRLVEEYAPPSVAVNEQHDIVHLSERAGRYLHFAGGEPSNNLLRTVHPDLRLELRTALYEAAQTRAAVETRRIATTLGDHSVGVQMSVRPVIREGDTAQGFFLVLFHESQDGVETVNPPPPSAAEPARQLEEEVVRLKSQLRATVEQHETQSEELKAANEELQAMNEELRSAAEELETSKEELQSVNEELITVNQELKIKIEEQVQANNDIQNLVNSTDIAAVFLDRSYRIKLFTPRARDLFALIPSDRGRPLTDISSLLNEPDLHGDVVRVLDRLERVEREVSARDDRWYLMRVFPYRTADDRIEGVILTFVDITERRRGEQRLQQVNDSLEDRVRDRTQELETANRSLDLQLAEREAAEERVRRLLSRLVTVQEDERRRVARDLHDQLGQHIAALRLKLSALGAGAAHEDALRLLDRLDRDVDLLTWQLRPVLLDDLGLHSALARYVSEWSAHSGIDGEFQSGPMPGDRFDPSVETHVYRIVQEALNNVLKHSGAKRVGVLLEWRDGVLQGVIEDDGQGFVLDGGPGTARRGEGLGLAGMHERAALIGGTVEIETAPGKGTSVFVRVPL